jgi:hypothetical protein
MTDLLLSDAELVALTGYQRQAEQLAELQRQGFSRARRDRAGRVVLERAHYEAVCAGHRAPADRPRVRPPKLRGLTAA